MVAIRIAGMDIFRCKLYFLAATPQGSFVSENQRQAGISTVAVSLSIGRRQFEFVDVAVPSTNLGLLCGELQCSARQTGDGTYQMNLLKRQPTFLNLTHGVQLARLTGLQLSVRAEIVLQGNAKCV